MIRLFLGIMFIAAIAIGVVCFATEYKDCRHKQTCNSLRDIDPMKILDRAMGQ